MLQAVGLSLTLEFPQISHESSLPERIATFIAQIFSEIKTVLENFLFRFTDPNWRAFQIKCQGHLIGDEHRETFLKIIPKVEQIFDRYITAAPEEKLWHHAHREAKESRCDETHWTDFSETHGGTCFGNSVALGYAILKANRLLSLEELSRIEASDSFVEMAQAIQHLSNTAGSYNQTVIKKGLPMPSCALEEGLNRLGLTLEAYQSSPHQTKIDRFLALGIQQKDLLGSLDHILSLNPWSFALSLKMHRDRLLKRELAPSKLWQIPEFQFYPKNSLQPILDANVNAMQKKIETNPLISSSEFKGFLILGGIAKDANDGHAVLLQIDHEKKIFTLYDNNRGFYQWDDYAACIAEVQRRFEEEGYETFECLGCSLIN